MIQLGNNFLKSKVTFKNPINYNSGFGSMFVIQPEYVHSNMCSFCIYAADSIIIINEEAQSSSHQDFSL